MIATEWGAELSVNGLEVGRDEQAGHREAVTDAFGNGDEVGLDAKPLVCEELSRTAVAALYLVADKDGAVALAGGSKTLRKLRCRHLYAADALYALYDDGAHIALVQLFLPCGEVVERQVGNVSAVVDGGYYLRVICHLHRKRSATVESLLR